MNLAIIPAPVSSDPYVELSRTTQGRLFRKHILTLGNLIHPVTGETLKLDANWYARLKDNFSSKVCDIVQVPIADAANKHTEDPLRNIGEVVDLGREGDKVYAMIDARDADAADKLGKTLLGASAFMHMDYTDTRTGKKVGPALLHVAVTNRPYVTGLGDYEEVVAASADSEEDAIVLAQPEEPPVLTKEELLAALKDDHGIDVEAIQAAAASRPDTAALTNAIVEALKGTGTVDLGGAGGTVGLTQEDLVGAVVELAQSNKAMAGDISKLQRQNAEQEVDRYVGEGRIMPKQRNRYVELALTNRDMFDDLLPENAIVKLNHQEGVAKPDGEQRQVEDIDAEIAKLTAAHSEFFTPDGTKAK